MKAKCNHSDSFPIEEGLWCPDCQSIVAVTCPACGGEEFVYLDDYECDWINEPHEIVTCPECKGTGWVSDPTWQ